jgi:sulfite reductase alpha subunit
MVSHPRTSSYVKTDDWDEQARKWFDRKAAKAGAEAAE